MFVECCVCRAAMPSVDVAIDDDANGKVSSGICDTCKPTATREARQTLRLVLDCEGCGTALAIDGVCPACHVGHDGIRCADCGRYAFHRDDCPKMQPPPVQDLIHIERPNLPHGIAEAGKAFLVGMGLWSLPGGIWVVPFVPWAILAMCGGGR